MGTQDVDIKLYITIAAGILILLYFFYPSKREGSQGLRRRMSFTSAACADGKESGGLMGEKCACDTL